MCKLYVGSLEAPHRLKTGGGWRRTCVWRERRWPNFILWRWAGPAQGGWTHCPRNPPSLPLPGPQGPSISMSRLLAVVLVARPPGRLVAPPVKPPGQPGVQRARLPAKVGRPLAKPVGPPSVRPASPVVGPRRGAPLVRPPARVVEPLVKRPGQLSAPPVKGPGQLSAPLVKGPGQLSAPRERAPARPGDRAGGDRLSYPVPARPGPRRS
jgi:hypothetical protein